MNFTLIFMCKIIENILSTLRIIFISTHKKILGSIINTMIAIIWLFSTISVINCITSEPQNVIAYILGYFFGTYLGCYIEEKLALGNNMITCITSNNNMPDILRKNGYLVTTIDGYGIEKQNILLIMISRKKVYKLFRLIKNVDKKSLIAFNNINYFNK